MLDTKIAHITVGGVEYPLAFTLNVAEQAQEEYGSLQKWTEALSSGKGKEPKLKDVIWSFTQFINEGIDIENDKNCEKREFLTHKQVGRLITGIDLNDLISTMHKVVSDSTSADNKEKEKNV